MGNYKKTCHSPLFFTDIWGSSHLESACIMCFARYKTPARFPDCKGKTEGNCMLFEPTKDHIQWCEKAEERGSICDPVTPTTQTSSTKRKLSCPQHRVN